MASSRTDASRPHHIYCLGINLPDPEMVTPLGKFADIKRIVDADLDRARRNGHPCTLQVLDCGDIEGSLVEFERRLTEMKDGIDAVMFGAGVRTKHDVVPFERALGVLVRVLGDVGGREGGVRILLNDGPDRHCWAIERGFGVVMEKE